MSTALLTTDLVAAKLRAQGRDVISGTLLVETIQGVTGQSLFQERVGTCSLVSWAGSTDGTTAAMFSIVDRERHSCRQAQSARPEHTRSY